jgi:protein-S-isoprenylcysteine O-methyltransferase Ste14
MLVRAAIAFLVLPGMVAYVVPLLLAPQGFDPVGWQRSGLVLMVLGTVLLLWCVRDFYVSGKGTLAPWSPPRSLVRVGLYRRSRNPMYVAVLTVLVGWTMAYGSRALLIYAIAIAVAFHLRIAFYEEPWLARTFGDEWVQYRRQGRRWI